MPKLVFPALTALSAYSICTSLPLGLKVVREKSAPLMAAVLRCSDLQQGQGTATGAERCSERGVRARRRVVRSIVCAWSSCCVRAVLSFCSLPRSQRGSRAQPSRGLLRPQSSAALARTAHRTRASECTNEHTAHSSVPRHDPRPTAPPRAQPRLTLCPASGLCCALRPVPRSVRDERRSLRQR